MEEKREVCVCEKCGNEAEMIITCSYVTVESEGEGKLHKKETRTCSVCGNEADIIIGME